MRGFGWQWAEPASSGLVANGEADPSSRFDAEVDYGLALFGDRFTGTPNVGFGLGAWIAFRIGIVEGLTLC